MSQEWKEQLRKDMLAYQQEQELIRKKQDTVARENQIRQQKEDGLRVQLATELLVGHLSRPLPM